MEHISSCVVLSLAVVCGTAGFIFNQWIGFEKFKMVLSSSSRRKKNDEKKSVAIDPTSSNYDRDYPLLFEDVNYHPDEFIDTAIYEPQLDIEDQALAIESGGLEVGLLFYDNLGLDSPLEGSDDVSYCESCGYETRRWGL